MYHLFVGDDYYPSGGMNDYRGSFPSLEACEEWLEVNAQPVVQWAHAATFQEGKLVMACEWSADRGGRRVVTYPNGQQFVTDIHGWKREPVEAK